MLNRFSSRAHRVRNLAALAVAAVVGTGQAGHAAEYDYDVIVYGGTSGGVTAAVQAAREGKRVALVDPGVYTVDLETAGAPGRYVSHLGGLSSSGLGATDIGSGNTVGGTSYEFFRRLQQKGQIYSNWRFTPGNAENVFDEMVEQAGVDVFRLQQLDRENGVTVADSRIASFTTKQGNTFKGKVFIDAGYEGDLMAAAGVGYTVGREARSQYGETFNGLAYDHTRHHDFEDNNAFVDPYVVPGDPSSGRLPGVHEPGPVGPNGAGDHRIQAYTYRMTMTRSSNRVAWSDFFANAGVQDLMDTANIADRFELHNRYADEKNNKIGAMMRTDKPVGGGKYDINNWGPASTNYIGGNYDVLVPETGRTVNYAEANDVEREYIIREHIRYVTEFLHFMAHDPQLSSSMNKWGFAPDEFTDNANFPHHLYVREARRMIGEYVMTELNTRDFGNPVDVPAGEEIGIGSYAMDSHNTHRYIRGDGYVEAEGNFWLDSDTRDYSIAYGTITPKEQEIENLLVSSAFSASHLAYGSMRMEPVFMILGQAAGMAASMSIEDGTSVQDIDRARLQALLRAYGSILTPNNEPNPGPYVGTVREAFAYGEDNGRLERRSYIAPGFAEHWDANGDDPQYDGSANLTYNGAGYVNDSTIAPNGAASGATGLRSGHIAERDLAGDGMAGTIWFTTLMQLGANTGGHEALLWLDGGADLGVGLNEQGELAAITSGTEQTTGNHAAGQTHLLLGQIIINDSGSSDLLNLWLNPDLQNLDAADLVLSGSDLFGDALNTIGISVGPNGGIIDAIRLSNADDAFQQVIGIPLMGDLNGDGMVNTDDISQFVHVLVGYAPYNPLADFNDDNIVDGWDIELFVQMLDGVSQQDITAAIPEPNTLLLIGFAGAACLRRRRR
jgi:hypothetical protein